MRYVERNALRAGFVARAEHWRWSSLRWRTTQGSWQIELAQSPIPLPDNWVNYVNEPQTPAELESIRTCIQRQRPFGTDGWVEGQASELGLLHTLAPLGRPRRIP
jgi:putative transposase